MGQIGQAMKNPNTMAPDPSGFNKTEWATRFAGKGLAGLGQGMQGMGQPQQPMGQGMINPAQGAQPVDPSYFTPVGGRPMSKSVNNPFFGS